MFKIKFLILCMVFFVINTNSLSKENDYFLTLKNNKVNVRYGPGFDYKIKYINLCPWSQTIAKFPYLINVHIPEIQFLSQRLKNLIMFVHGIKTYACV